MDRAKLERGIRLFLEGLAPEADAAESEGTPQRVARAWVDDLVSGYAIDPEAELGWTPVAEGGGPVLVRDLSIASICVHHLLPFFGVAHVAYLPGTRQAGLSKIGRVIDAHARRLQTQERLSREIAATLARGLACRGVLVVIRAEHTCMALRGVRKERSEMVTIAATGVYDDDRLARAEILSLLASGTARSAAG